MLVLPVCPALRRLLLRRGSTPNLVTKLVALESAVFRHFAPYGQLSGVSSILHSQQGRIAQRLSTVHDSIANADNTDWWLRGKFASAVPLCACHLAD